MKKLLTGAFVVVGLAVLSIGACGGDDDEDEKTQCQVLADACGECANADLKTACNALATATGDTAEDACKAAVDAKTYGKDVAACAE